MIGLSNRFELIFGLTFGLLLLLGAYSASARIAAETFVSFEIESELPAQIERANIPGLAYAIVNQDRVETKASGLLQHEGESSVTPDTPFLLGSISKSFTALAVMQMIEAGEVELEKPIGQYLPAFSGTPAGKATIRQLLSHTSGFSTYQGNQGYNADQLAQQPLSYNSGVQWDYSNANYVILGALIEQVSTKTYADYMAAHIFTPLGMTNSSADGIEPDGAAQGHLPWFFGRKLVEPDRGHRSGIPAGGIYASANDMALYLAAMMNGEDDILSAAGKARMLSPASDASPFYGFGWFIDDDTGTAYHEGTSPGVETLATINLADQCAVIVLTNAGSGMGFGETGHVRFGIANIAAADSRNFTSPSWGAKAMFLTLVLLPFFFAICIWWAWRHREVLRAKTGISGLFSLWFPLVSLSAMAWVFIYLVPHMFGVTLSGLHTYAPDLAIGLLASGVTGVLWAVVRLVIAYSGRKWRKGV